MMRPDVLVLFVIVLSWQCRITRAADCADKRNDCTIFKPYCLHPNYSYLKTKCTKTCGLCECKDKLTYCDYYDNKKLCNNPLYDQLLTKYCEKTCKKCVITCGIKPKIQLTPPGIVGGTEVRPGDWPWQVTYSYRTSSHHCGGSLVAHQWIVTAAHCFARSTQPTEYRVTVGQHDLNNKDGEEKTIAIEKLIIHPQYVGPFDYDIALIKLKTNLTYTFRIKPVCIIDDDIEFPVGTNCYVTGWGALKEGGPQSAILQQAKVPLVSQAVCQSAYNDLGLTISDRMICAGYDEGKIDACQGDSGGPLVCEKNGAWYLTGTVSWGEGCARRKRYGVYTNIKDVKSWIQKTIANN